MKNLKTILQESILSPGGPEMFDEGVMSTIYEVLDGLPRTEIITSGRYCFPEAALKKANQKLKKIKLDLGQYVDRGREVFKRPGVAFFSCMDREADIWFACWNKDTYLLSRWEELEADPVGQYIRGKHTAVVDTVKKAGFSMRGLGNSPLGGIWPTFECWTLLWESGVDLTRYGNYMGDDYADNECIYFPGNPNMELIKKILDSKLK